MGVSDAIQGAVNHTTGSLGYGALAAVLVRMHGHLGLR
jgi:hypothetical protein